MSICITKNREQFLYLHTKFNSNFNRNIKSFHILNIQNNFRYFNFFLKRQFKENNLLRIHYKLIQDVTQFQNKVIDKKFNKLEPSKNLKRFLFLIPFFELKIRFLLIFNFKHNIQKNPDFIIFLNLKFLNENNIVFLEYFINKNKKIIRDNSKKFFFFLVLLNKITANNLNQNNFLASINKKNSDNSFFLKNVQFYSKSYIDCIFIYLNHFIFDFLYGMKIIFKTKRYKYSFFFLSLKNFVKKYSEPFFFSWYFKLVKKTEINLKNILKLFIKNIISNYFLKYEYSDEFGSSFLTKQKGNDASIFNKFDFFFLWGDPYIY
nr:hypothetical protein CcurKRNrm3_p058 [Cryptomonas curvata]